MTSSGVHDWLRLVETEGSEAKHIDVQRKLLRARDAEIDALYEARQATADLAFAVGDPLLAVPDAATPA